jgi:hypothetical protein
MKKQALLFALLVFFCTMAFSQSSKLFDQDDLLEITFSGPVGELMKDRGDDPQYHTFSLKYKDSENLPITLPVQIKARGHFRKLKQNCAYPPLLLNFSKATSNHSIFSSQSKLKLVTPCRDEKYVVREYLVYKMYQLITPRSFKVRLVKFTLSNDDPKGKRIEPLFGILIEEEDQMAKRNECTSLDGVLVRPEQTQRQDFLNMAVFEYMIGNTDWSVQYAQNVKLISSEKVSLPITVPYDFDHSGIVNAPYAKPAEALLLTSTRERRYRGYCIQNMDAYKEVIARFNEKKADLYKVYAECSLLDEGYLKSTVKFLDEFYKTINDPKRLKNEFEYPCRPEGTGNVVIQGLKKN